MSTSVKKWLLFFFCLPMEDIRTNFTSDVLLGIFSMIPMDVSLQDLERLLQREGESTQREHRLGWSWHGSNAWNASPSQCEIYHGKLLRWILYRMLLAISMKPGILIKESLAEKWVCPFFWPVKCCASGVNYIGTWHIMTPPNRPRCRYERVGKRYNEGHGGLRDFVNISTLPLREMTKHWPLSEAELWS